MKRIVSGLLLLGFVCWGQSDFELVREKFRAREAQDSVKSVGAGLRPFPVCDLNGLLALMNDDGTVKGGDYQTNERGYWPLVGDHLFPLRRLAEFVYASRQTPDPRAVDAFHRVLGWWLRQDPKNSNWWWNEIGVPQILGESCLIFTEPLTSEELAGVGRILRRADASTKTTGQNHVWLARIKLMRALIEQDPVVAREAVDAIAGEIFLSDAEGIRPDWCFHQHGRQPQFGNYGLGYVVLMTRLANVLAGTSYAFPPEKMALLRGLLEHGFRWICWKGRMDLSAMGRQITPGAQSTKAQSTRQALMEYKRIDPTFPLDFPQGFRFYDKSAYAIYRTDRWMASVRMSTREVQGVETWINSENVLGGHLADGCLLTYVTGQEYDDVCPLWNDWRLVPGITSYKGVPPVSGRAPNQSDTVRGFETNGVAVVEMEFQRKGLRALKSWRFSPQVICCEGREIVGTDPTHPVVTTVEQAHAAPTVEIFPPAKGLLKVLNGAIGYVIEATEETCHRAVEARSGDFRSFNLKQPSCPREGKVLSIWIDHGVCPQGGTYRYWVLPATTREDLISFTPDNF